jgi:hypothetical protein
MSGLLSLILVTMGKYISSYRISKVSGAKQKISPKERKPTKVHHITTKLLPLSKVIQYIYKRSWKHIPGRRGAITFGSGLYDSTRTIP